jgi:uncharacterized protein YdeI (YjbR/CyaY-like superfamily)
VPSAPGRPRFFVSPEAFGKWLAANHSKRSELLVGYWKVATGKASMTWAQSVEQALRYGWIDGVRRSLGEDSYVIRFTPRRRGSHWSNVNVRMAKRLVQEGTMAPAGLAAFKARSPARTGQGSYAQRKPVPLPAAAVRALQADKAAWADFQARAPHYRKAIAWWIVNAKREETRERRIQHLVESSREGKVVRGWEWGAKARAARRTSEESRADRRASESV